MYNIQCQDIHVLLSFLIVKTCAWVNILQLLMRPQFSDNTGNNLYINNHFIKYISLAIAHTQESAEVYFSYDSPLIAQIQTRRTILKFRVGHGCPYNQMVGCRKSLPCLYC